MSEKRRQELSEEALERIEWEELGFGSFGGRALVDGEEANFAFGDRSLYFFALSYSRAFEALWDEVWSGQEELEYPMLFVWRHSMELWLKVAVAAASLGAKQLTGHKLKDLWEELMGVLYDVPPTSVEDEFAKVVWPVVDSIHEHDGSGDRFRYPASSTSAPYRSTEADWDEVFRAHWLVVGYCDAVVTEMNEREIAWAGSWQSGDVT